MSTDLTTQMPKHPPLSPPQLKTYKDIHVVGISGVESAALTLFLIQKKISFTGHDFGRSRDFRRNLMKTHAGYPARKKGDIVNKLSMRRSQTCFAKSYLRGVEKADLIFVSQNWSAYSPNRKLYSLYQRYPERFHTITQLYFTLFPGRILAITGTNGKSTTARLLADILGKGREKTWFTGNDRRNIQILDSYDKWTKNDLLLIEVSNRQLKFDLGRAPDIGVITNVARNHLDEYGGSFMKYKACKYSLIREQTNRQVTILNQDNQVTRQFGRQARGVLLPYSVTEILRKGVYISDDWIVYRDVKITKVLPLSQLKLSGRHNLSNILAAIVAARVAGTAWRRIREAVARFRGIPQRLETVGRSGGVSYIDDSTSTSPDSTIAALTSLQAGSVHWIAGGDPKGLSYARLARVVKERAVRSVTLIRSPATKLIARELRRLKISSQIVRTPEEAVRAASRAASRGESVLLSPAAAYYIYFGEQGSAFRERVRRLTATN